MNCGHRILQPFSNRAETFHITTSLHGADQSAWELFGASACSDVSLASSCFICRFVLLVDLLRPNWASCGPWASALDSGLIAGLSLGGYGGSLALRLPLAPMDAVSKTAPWPCMVCLIWPGWELPLARRATVVRHCHIAKKTCCLIMLFVYSLRWCTFSKSQDQQHVLDASTLLRCAGGFQQICRTYVPPLACL